MGEPRWFYRTPEDWKAIALRLKQTPCPHCQRVGTLNQHGGLFGYDESSPPRQTLRARRVFCSNRRRRPGCGRTFSVWRADTLRRRALSTRTLGKFLQHAAERGITAALRELQSPWSERTWQRLWRCFLLGQSRIRTALWAHARPPPPGPGPHLLPPTRQRLAQQVLAHLQAAFGHAECPLAAFQQATRTFFL